jgi:phenylalanyl-tRNA synthetase beta subunit
MVALTVTDKKSRSVVPYYQAKKMLEYLGGSLGLDLMYSSVESDPNYPVTAPFELRRSALVTDKKTDTFIGIVGEYKKSVARNFKLPEYTAGFEIGSPALYEAVKKLTNSYRPVSRYPSTERDICFQVASDVRYQQIIDSMESVLRDTEIETVISPVDIYQQENDASTKNITVRIKLTAGDHTLTGDEVATIIGNVTEATIAAIGATVI